MLLNNKGDKSSNDSTNGRRDHHPICEKDKPLGDSGTRLAAIRRRGRDRLQDHGERGVQLLGRARLPSDWR